MTVTVDAAGRFFASFVVETEPTMLPATGTTVGIDLGLSHFAVLSDGTKVSAHVPAPRRETSQAGTAG